MRRNLPEYDKLATGNPIFKARMQDIGYLDLAGCMALGATGPILRATGLPHDLRKTQPYCGYETYDFEVPTADSCDAYGRFLIRIEEMRQSLRIVEQCLDRSSPDRSWSPTRRSPGPPSSPWDRTDSATPSTTSRRSWAPPWRPDPPLQTGHRGFRVPPGQAYAAVESPKGELGVHAVSDGGTRPYRVHFRDPSFTNLQAMAAMCEGGQVADVIVAVASIDP